MSKDTSSAFPMYIDGCGPEWGLTKREYFAAMALQGFLANGLDKANAHALATFGDGLPIKDGVSELAVSFADALINALKE